MKTPLFATVFLVAAALVAPANAGVSPAVWNTPTSGTVATGTFAGGTITAVTTSSSPFLNMVFEDRFAGAWDGSMPLDTTATALVTTNVNAGDSQAFGFSSAIADGLFYIENFDASSIASIQAIGATSLSLVDSSGSISFVGAGDSGTLTTSNAGFDGEGDAVLQFTGAVTEIRIQYSSGEGANGVMYTFAEPSSQAVPEPTSALVMAGLFGFGGAFTWYRRRKQDQE